MRIGEQLRTLTVEPVVDPVPDGDFPEHLAEVGPLAPGPTSGSGAAAPDRPEIVAPTSA